MDVIDGLYLWTDRVLLYGELALWIWAFVDCVTRKVAAFPAVNKLTKPAWAGMLLLGALFGYLLSNQSPIGLFPLVATVLAGVYLADVRPAVREISG